MDRLLKRAKAAVDHLTKVDEFFAANLTEYREIQEKLHGLGDAYESFSKELYVGEHGRQMILCDFLTYILTSRGCFWGYTQKNRKAYFKAILYVINQLLLQEPITMKTYADLRKKLMQFMRKQGIENFFENESSEQIYKEAMAFAGDLSYADKTRQLYYAVDSLLPKSIGTVIELIVYLYLIRHNCGYVVPLLLHQRLLSKESHLIEPDFLVIKNGKIFGIEVKQAWGDVPDHIFTFSSETTIPVIVARVPNTVPLRCPVCNRWILYCDEVIEKFSDTTKDIKDTRIQCTEECKRFAKCRHVIYFGLLKQTDNKEYHYHYTCVKNKYPYVNEVLANEKQRKRRLIAYFPYVQGLESLEKPF